MWCHRWSICILLMYEHKKPSPEGKVSTRTTIQNRAWLRTHHLKPVSITNPITPKGVFTLRKLAWGLWGQCHGRGGGQMGGSPC